MKKPIFLMVATAVCGLLWAVNPALAQGTAFIYQGQLNADGAPANGVYDFEFALYNNAAGLGNPISSTLTNAGLAVANGFFSTTLDFGDAFAGNATWLAMFVRSNGVGNYTPLTPLQELLPTPYAIFANTASNLSGTLPAAQVSGTIPAAQLPGTVVTNNQSSVTLGNLTVTGAFTADGGGLTNLSAWQLAGNTGTTSENYLGTADNQPLQIRVAGAQAGLITPNNGSPNVVFGPSANIINNGSAASSILGGSNNSVAATSSYSVIGGGSQNAIATGDDHTFVGGGFNNTVQSGAYQAVLGGGTGNVIGASAYDSVVGGGADNVVFGNAFYAVVGGGSGNQIQGGADQSFIGGGGENAVGSDHATIGGGLDNEIESGASYSAVGGGLLNIISGEYSFIGSGYDNMVAGNYAAVAGGYDNQATGNYATVPGGATNLASGQFSFAAGVNAQATNSGAFVWADNEGTVFTSTNTNSFNVRANGGVRFVTGGAGITVDGQPLIAGSGGLTNGQAGVSLPGLTLSGSLNLDGANINIYAGFDTLLYNDNKGNSFTGLDAGNVITTGSDNIASGAGALGDNTTGNENTATGRAALGLNRTGNYNTATGAAALYDNVGGSYNVAAGYSALYANGSGGENVAIGSLAMAESTADSGVVAIGYQALENDAGGPGLLSVGSANTAVGYQSLKATTSGTGDTGLGYQSLEANTSGYNNTAVGNWALLANTGGSENTVVGALALSFSTSGSSNTALGVSALGSTSADSGLVAIGYGALQNDNAVNTGNTSSGNGENTAVGFEALGADTSGAANTAVGFEALMNNTLGNFNTATGHHALTANTAGSANVAYGDLALYNNQTGSNNVGLGAQSLLLNTSGNENTVIGYQALRQGQSGNGNVAVGTSALHGDQAGNGNTALGSAALNISTGNTNIAIGNGAGANLTSGDYNIYIGNGGHANETGVIRIGQEGFQTQTYLAGTVTGDGSGLTNVTASTTSIPQGMALIPGGPFLFGDSLDGESDAIPATSVTVSAFYMDINLVTYPQWQSVYFWATSIGYTFDDSGNGTTQWGVYDGLNKPVQGVNWFDCVKWCNARSQQAGLTPVYYLDNGFSQIYRTGDVSSVVPNWAANGFRLPTEAEWEKAARGGLAGQRFPWGMVINENLANYNNNGSTYAYDLGGNTQFAVTGSATYPPNLYGLYDMGGNLFSWCWDWYAPPPFPRGSPYLGGTDPRGPGTQGSRVVRGCGFGSLAIIARCANRSFLAPSTIYANPLFGYGELGFRCARSH